MLFVFWICLRINVILVVSYEFLKRPVLARQLFDILIEGRRILPRVYHVFKRLCYSFVLFYKASILESFFLNLLQFNFV